MRPLQPDDPVVTPSGRHAVVVRRLENGDRFECRYLEQDLADDERFVVLPVGLLRRIEPGVVPPPARINGKGTPG